MELKPIIYEFARYVMDASPDHSWEIPEIADLAAEQMRNPEERSKLRAAIEALLNSNLDDDELNRLWSSTNASVMFKKNGARLFLTESLSALDRHAREQSR